MRKKELLTGALFVYLLFSGCQKNDKSQPSTNYLIGLTKASLEAQKHVGYNNSAFIDSLEQQADWAGLKRYAVNAMEFLVYVPVKYNSNLTGLVYLVNKKDSIETSYFLQLASQTAIDEPGQVVSDFYSYALQNISVDLSAYTFNRSLKWEMSYKDGVNQYRKMVLSGVPPTAGNTGRRITVSSQGKKEVTGGNCTDYYLVTYWSDGSEDWEYIGSECTSDCTISTPIQAGGFGARIETDAVTVTCGGGSGGGGGSGSSSSTTQDEQDIESTLTNKCFQAVLAKLMQGGMNSDLLTLFQSTFNSSDKVNLYYSESQTVSNDPSIPAYTHATLTSTSVNISTTLADGKMDGSSQEYIAETMLHEAIHGFFDAIGGFTELQQHTAMLTGWIDCEQNALKELFPNLAPANALCLIFGGMGDVQAADPALFNSTIASYGLNASQITMTNNMYNAGVGTPCPSGGGGAGGGTPQP